MAEIRPECYVIVNPNAGSGKGRKDWKRISDLLRKDNILTESVFTERKGHAIELSAAAIRNGFRKIVTVGGDGTLNEVVNGLFMQTACRSSDVTLALIPVGTGNDWGRMFGIPTVYNGAVDVIRDNKQLQHDVGLVTYHNGDVENKRYFINIAGLGFESIVVRKTNKQKDKGRSNKAIYFFNLLTSLISHRNINATISVDGEISNSRIFSINVGNGRYCGGGMRQTPEALPDDGLLDVTVLREMGRLEIIRNLNLLYDGSILSHPKVDGYRVKKLDVTSESLLYVEADGESLGHTPASFTVIPGALKVVYGTKLIQ
jgi:YegS/Rv2252/BmrU family lipid kinase